MNRVTMATAVALVLFALAAEASQQGQTALKSFKQMDNCARQAQAAYPDFTAESNAKRDAKLKECLNSGNLPPRQPSSPPPR
jgi:membrane protease subunit (stomatin/prohibitin family)